MVNIYAQYQQTNTRKYIIKWSLMKILCQNYFQAQMHQGIEGTDVLFVVRSSDQADKMQEERNDYAIKKYCVCGFVDVWVDGREREAETGIMFGSTHSLRKTTTNVDTQTVKGITR